MESAAKPLRLLSYNIHKGIGGRDRRYRLDRVIEVIRHEHPDLICLQEVDTSVKRTRHDRQHELFVEAFRPAAHLYQLNVRLKEGGYGNLVLSRWPIEAHHSVSLRLGWRKPRGAQVCVVNTPEGPLHLVHWHLGLNERERHWQAEHLLQQDCFRESCHLPTLIVGDYNDWWNTLGPKGALGAQGFHQATAPRSRFRSFPAYLPMTALDKAFTRNGVDVRHARLSRTRLARDASDHLPLVVDFHLRPAADA